MKTQIKKYGNSTVLILPPEFLKYHEAEVGDWMDIADCMIIKKGKTNGQTN